MTHPNSVTNGASLEDCHTNFFALTDLCGIKWRRLCAENVFCVDALDDPVLVSYTKCLAADILCVWRRVPTTNLPFPSGLDHGMSQQQQQRPSDSHQLHYPKELWLFWYGEEPDLTKILCSELSDLEHGSWEMGLSYECRTLLFKALHNLIERYLICHGFARLGQWFVQPHSTKDNDNPHLTFKFNFFVHGESTVCASVDVREHPAVCRLDPSHIVQAQSVQNGVQVILGPYGLKGMLSGQCFKDSNHVASKLLEEWKQFYPISSASCDMQNNMTDSSMPAMVEVIVAGVKMKYPTCFVYVTQTNRRHPNRRSPNAKRSNTTPNSQVAAVMPLTPPSSPTDRTNNHVFQPSISNWSFPESVRNRKDFTPKLISKVSQDNSMPNGNMNLNTECKNTSGSQQALCDGSAAEDSLGQWNIHDPSHKSQCNCLRLKKKSSSASNDKKAVSTTASNANRKADKTDKPHSKNHRAISAFHRRSPASTDAIELLDIDLMLRKSTMKIDQQSASNQNGSAENLPQLRQDATCSVSPHSVAPSPLLASASTHSQSTALGTGDPTMPTLSPHPPLNQNHNESQQDQENVAPGQTGPEDPAKQMPPRTPQDAAVKTEPPFSPYVNTPSVDEKSSEIMHWAQQANMSGELCGIKRPILSSLNYEEFKDEDLSCSLLYDYTLLHAWVDHPVKRFKPENFKNRFSSLKFNQRSVLNGQPEASLQNGSGPDQRVSDNGIMSIDLNSIRSSKDPYEFTEGDDHEHAAQAAAALENNDPLQANAVVVKTEIDDNSLPNADSNLNGLTNGNKDESSQSPSTPKPAAQLTTFTTEKDLIVTGLNDLDQIFDTSGDDSDGGNSFQAPTPPGSNKPATNMSSDEGMTTVKSSRSSSSANAIPSLGAAELVRMFPTPPSLEHNPAPSPCNAIDCSGVDIDWATGKDKSELHANCALDSTRDWTYVFKMPEKQTMIRSSKYAPLTNLPSCQLPALSMPSDCVYKPWQEYCTPNIEKSQPISQMNMLPPDVDRTPHSVRSVMAPSPMTVAQGMEHRLPMNYELPSPASNASSYLNKNLNSVDSSVLSHIPEAHSLLVNVVLSDSLLNLFKDHNFDSCTMCVCNSNIRGADAGVYLPGPLLPSRTDEAQYKCTCGFSAVRNRHLSYQAGLFYEDEFEITGIKDDGLDRRKASMLTRLRNSNNNSDGSGEQLSESLMDLLITQSVMSYSTANSLHRTALLPRDYSGAMLASSSSPKLSIGMLDACEVCFLARDTGKQAVDNINNAKLDECLKYSSMHHWPHISAKPPSNSQDVIRVMKTIQPMLQDAIQKKRTTRLWEATYTVSGPLTWRQFHRLAGRGTEDQCEPQPVPSLLVGYDKEWLAVSPFAIKYWEKLLLEPYAVPRDVGYIILAPENDFILEKVRVYFKELSRAYEICNMGKHCPITKVLRDGIMRIGKVAAKKVADEPVDEWFDAIGNTPLANKLKLYAQVCRHRLAPHLATEQLDANLLDIGSDRQCGVSPMHPPATPDSSDTKDSASSNTIGADSSEQSSNKDSSKAAPATGSIQEPDPEDEQQIPAIVIYMVDPFSYLARREEYSEVHRLAMLGLLRCYSELLKNLPEKMQNNIHLQIISLDSIMNLCKDEDRSRSFDRLKGLAFSVFTQCRRMLTHQSTAKSLTGFGPAASQDLFLNTKDEKNSGVYSLFSPAYILAPTKDKQTELSELFGDRREKSSILFCSYCLSEDQQWLLASCTDDRGEIIDTCAINIEIPNRTRRKKASARKVGLAKLIDFLLGVMSNRIHPWRLVIGRLGRMGHGELKGWNNLLSKKSLMRASKHLQGMCKQCAYNGPLESPVILSACLVNIEPDSALTILCDQYTPDERFSSSCNSCPLSTPQDASCTHILVFPTSATTQSSQTTFQQEHIDDPLGAEDIFSALNEDFQVDQDINAIFNFSESPLQSPNASPHRGGSSHPGSPITSSGRQDPFQNHSQNQGPHGLMGDAQEETAQLAQQPLALGYYVSTAKTGPLPKWFWSSCSHLENSCPAFLKSALLIHSPSAQQNSEDLLHNNAHVHPLDSNLTTDVLRYVLEGYNSLSWLSIDPTSHDRRSCLPVHIQVLMQMYHTMQALI